MRGREAGRYLFTSPITAVDMPTLRSSAPPPPRRTAKVPSLPQDLFMIMRVITLLRGLLSSLQVDISSAQLWRPLALQVRRVAHAGPLVVHVCVWRTSNGICTPVVGCWDKACGAASAAG